ncbi:GNAT family N-acetyltransferase [Desemzia incerta]|uniref:GNAT family N-acetyltransferase n=1 Tax=Desemzia incerta TaxID=82801 RepID=UPI003314A8E7
MIKKIDLKNSEQAKEVLQLQISAYKVEAELIEYDAIPPLKDTIETLQQTDELFYGIYEQNELFGAISIKIDHHIMDIHRLVVHPKNFRKGYAQMLLDFIEKEFIVDKIIVSTGCKNLPAVSFYKKNQFRLVREALIENRLKLCYFEKLI